MSTLGSAGAPPGADGFAPTGADGFAARLRRRTRAAHSSAEGSAFLADLLAGRLGRPAHAAMLAQLHPVYEALEVTGRALADDPAVSPFLDQRLLRLPSLEADLLALLGHDWRDALTPSAATSEYTHRLKRTSEAPVRFVVHHYLRYLGDLSGGQAVAALLDRCYAMGPHELSFYRFELAPAPYRAHYRELLDAAPWSAHEQEDFITEAQAGYHLNRAVLDDLGGRWCPSPS